MLIGSQGDNPVHFYSVMYPKMKAFPFLGTLQIVRNLIKWLLGIIHDLHSSHQSIIPSVFIVFIGNYL